MDKFNNFSNKNNPEEDPAPRKTTELKISEEEVEAFVGLLEKAVTHQEKARIIRIAMSNSSAEAAIAANDVMSSNMKEISALATGDDSLLATIAIKDSYFLGLNRNMKKYVDTNRKEIGLPPKFSA